MNVYSLRAMTLDNKPIEFTVLDVPVIVGEDRCVLLNRKFSPILKYSTIVIGSDIGLYVGDVLKDMEMCIRDRADIPKGTFPAKVDEPEYAMYKRLLDTPNAQAVMLDSITGKEIFIGG